VGEGHSRIGPLDMPLVAAAAAVVVVVVDVVVVLVVTVLEAVTMQRARTSGMYGKPYV